MSLPSKVKVYQQTKFHRHISIRSWDITTSVSVKQTSAILKSYFRFLSQPFRRNLHVILHKATEFRPNRSSHCENLTSYEFLKMAAAQYYFRFRICWSHCLQKVKSIKKNKISSTYLNSRLRYNYFRFWKTNVCHIGILLPVSISTIFRNLHDFCIRLPNYIQIRAVYPCRNMTSYPFLKMAAGRDRSVLLPISYLLMPLPSEGQNQFRWHISIDG